MVFNGNRFDGRAWRRRFAATHLEEDREIRRGTGFDEFVYSVNTVIVDPIDDKPVGGQKPKRGTVFDGVQRSNPGVELLLGQIRAKLADAAVPDGGLHFGFPDVLFNFWFGAGARVYTR